VRGGQVQEEADLPAVGAERDHGALVLPPVREALRPVLPERRGDFSLGPFGGDSRPLGVTGGHDLFPPGLMRTTPGTRNSTSRGTHTPLVRTATSRTSRTCG